MKEQAGKRRDWIKNAIIVFLIIMLLLTFFSNTIMNYSLPEVSAQYISNGTIQAKVRGNGIVQAGNPYSVKSDASRTIQAVAVKDGAHVQKGDVLYYLEEGESTELKEAMKALEDMQEAYRQSVLAEGITPEDTNNMLNGKFPDYDTYYVQVQNLKNEIKVLEDDINLHVTEVDKVKDLQKDYINSNGGTAAVEKKQAYDAAVAARVNAEAALAGAKSTAGVAADTAIADIITQADAAKVNLDTAKAALDTIKNGTEYQQAEIIRAGYESAVETAKAELEAAANTGGDIGAATTKLNDAVAVLEAHKTSAVYTSVQSAEASYASSQDTYSKLNAVVNADTALKNALAAEANAKAVSDAAGEDTSVQIAQLQNVIDINEAYVAEQRVKVSEKQAALSDVLASIAQNSAMQKALDEIAEQKELIAKLKSGVQEGHITAPISGVVSGIMLKAGDSTPLNGEVATIIPEGTGYTMEVKVTRDQAQRLSKGDVADIQNAWYYSDVRAVLEQIKTDKSDPSNSRILVFHVEGDVADGQSLSISIGQKSANYDCLVPNSAVREDNNGKFILKVSQKSSPLGNRYYAERVDVEVLASDDTQSAVKGALEGWEFVITTSTKPVEAGQLIRLQD